MNCWEHLRCGRERGGARVAELGECPVSLLGAGEACWLIPDTFCSDRRDGSEAEKSALCLACGFYQRFDVAHRAKMWCRFGPNKRRPLTGE